MEALVVEMNRYSDEPKLNLYLREVVEAADEGRLVGSKRTVAAGKGLVYIAKMIARRIRKRWDAFVVITGPRGVGKSTLAMKLAKLVAKFLKKEWSPTTGLCYSGRELLDFYRGAVESKERGRIVVYDEGIRGLFSLDSRDQEQVALIRAINLVREAGCVVVLCIPDMMSLVKSVRTRAATLWLAVRSRGIARVHVRKAQLHYKPEVDFGFAVLPECPHLSWGPYRSSDPVWREYLPRKHKNLSDFFDETERKTPKVKAVETPRPDRPPNAPSDTRWLSMRMPSDPKERRTLRESMAPWEWEAFTNRERVRRYRERHGLAVVSPKAA